MGKPRIGSFLRCIVAGIAILPAGVLLLMCWLHEETLAHWPQALTSGQPLLVALLLTLGVWGVAWVLLHNGARRIAVDHGHLIRLLQAGNEDLAPGIWSAMRFRETEAMAQEVERMLLEGRKATAALQQSEERFRQAMDASQDGLWDWNVATGEVYFSPAYAAMLGFSPEEAAHEDLWPGRVHPEDKDAVLAANMDCVHNRVEHFAVEFRMRTKAGDWRWVLGRGRAVTRDAYGKATRMVGTHSDITERKRAEEELLHAQEALEELVAQRTRELAAKAEELERANQELRALDELKSGLVTVVSHELRTPLTSIYGFVRLIRKDFSTKLFDRCAEDPELRKRSDRIRTNLDIIELEGRRLGRIINDFLDLSKIESGQMGWNESPVASDALMRRAAKLVSPNYAAKQHVTLRVVQPERPCILHVDEDRMVQVLVNLLDNACKYTDSGEVVLASSMQDGQFVLSVADSGRGIAENDLEHVFDRFFQSPVHDAHGQVTKGTGLGLAICRQIVQHYQGRIWAESTQGVGTIFYVSLPVQADGQIIVAGA